MHGVNVQIPSCPDVIFISHRDIHSILQLDFRALTKVCVISPLSRITSLVCNTLHHLVSCQNTNNCVPAYFASQRTSGNRRKPNRVAPARMHAYNKKDVTLAYLNVLISQARISGCTKSWGRPFDSSRGWLSSRLVHGGIFTLAPGTSRDDGDLLNEEVGEGGTSPRGRKS